MNLRAYGAPRWPGVRFAVFPSPGTNPDLGIWIAFGVRYVVETSATRRPVVLIVEDESVLRTNAADVIGDAGFDVVEAGDADEAIMILEARPDIHVVFTDIQMPGSMDGLKLARFVRGRWPPIKIVATSGFVSVRKDDLPEGSRFVPKPYRAEQIVATLRDLTAVA
jgi:two-component system, response regulator PdtaR